MEVKGREISRILHIFSLGDQELPNEIEIPRVEVDFVRKLMN